MNYRGDSETEISDSIPVAKNSTAQTEQVCTKRISIYCSEVAGDTVSTQTYVRVRTPMHADETIVMCFGNISSVFLQNDILTHRPYFTRTGYSRPAWFLALGK